ncbi:hypothetical protein TWF694_001431 [Orbilia ellipsospora]|uniref:Uncharacterized protein n=1 Tax=Orbilia ellipsospora TaxID=2528407 RepID=A0AAV9XRM1_9PEZI
MVRLMRRWLFMRAVLFALNLATLVKGQGSIVAFANPDCTDQTFNQPSISVGSCVEFDPGDKSFKIPEFPGCTIGVPAILYAFDAPNCPSEAAFAFSDSTSCNTLGGGNQDVRSLVFLCDPNDPISSTISTDKAILSTPTNPTTSQTQEITTNTSPGTTSAVESKNTQSSSSPSTSQTQGSTSSQPSSSSTTASSTSPSAMPSPSPSAAPASQDGGLSKGDRITIGTTVGLGVAALIVAILAWQFPVQRNRLLHRKGTIH